MLNAWIGNCDPGTQIHEFWQILVKNTQVSLVYSYQNYYFLK
jgi:hypothetical protein